MIPSSSQLDWSNTLAGTQPSSSPLEWTGQNTATRRSSWHQGIPPPSAAVISAREYSTSELGLIPASSRRAPVCREACSAWREEKKRGTVVSSGQVGKT